MRPPSLVTAPVDRVVSLPELKDHLRVNFSDDDAFITSLEAAAVAHLDGWHGIMGRAIMPQTWAQEFDGWGCYDLFLLDADNIAVVGVTGGVETLATEVQVVKTLGGTRVIASGGSADIIRVTYDAALPLEQLPAVQAAVKLLVGHWYEHREAVSELALSETPMAVRSLLAPLRNVAI